MDLNIFAGSEALAGRVDAPAPLRRCENQQLSRHEQGALEYLGWRLDKHCYEARDAFDRLFALHHKRAET